MGNIVKLNGFNKAEVSSSHLVIYSDCSNEINEKATSINKDLAFELSKYRLQRRAIYLEQCLNKVLSKLEEHPTIKDFDVLFNPSYEIDVIKLLSSAYRKKAFSVVWCGKFANGKLQYSENGFDDYKIFDIDAYDITYII